MIGLILHVVLFAGLALGLFLCLRAEPAWRRGTSVHLAVLSVAVLGDWLALLWHAGAVLLWP